jgi:hypothetical protein
MPPAITTAEPSTTAAARDRGCGNSAADSDASIRTCTAAAARADASLPLLRRAEPPVREIASRTTMRTMVMRPRKVRRRRTRFDTRSRGRGGPLAPDRTATNLRAHRSTSADGAIKSSARIRGAVSRRRRMTSAVEAASRTRRSLLLDRVLTPRSMSRLGQLVSMRRGRRGRNADTTLRRRDSRRRPARVRRAPIRRLTQGGGSPADEEPWDSPTWVPGSRSGSGSTPKPTTSSTGPRSPPRPRSTPSWRPSLRSWRVPLGRRRPSGDRRRLMTIVW